MNEHQVLTDKINFLKRFLGKNSIQENDIESLNEFFKEFSFISGLTYKFKLPGFQRVTINSKIFNGEDKRISKVQNLENPPIEYVKRYGRANLIGNTVLYATDNALTALAEMRPKSGQLITISTWELKTDYDITAAAIFKNSPANKSINNLMTLRGKLEYEKIKHQYNENFLILIDNIIQFICDCFSKEVNDENHYDYFLSSHYAHQIFTFLQNGEIEVILYPSVRQSLELTNIAMKSEVFKANYEIRKVEESIVTGDLSKSSGWTLKETGQSEKFENGEIIW